MVYIPTRDLRMMYTVLMLMCDAIRGEGTNNTMRDSVDLGR